MGKSGNLKIESLRQQALEGLRLMTIYVSSELLGHSCFLEPGSGYLTQRDRLAFEASEEWRVFENQLLDLATSKAAQVSAGQVDEGPKKPLSWLSIRDAFLKGAQKYSEVVAVWGSSNRIWEMRPQTPESSALFAGTARLAIGLLRQSPNEEVREKANTFRKAEQVWLDLMREEGRGYVRAERPLRNFRQAAKAAELEFAYDIETPSGVGIDVSGIRNVFEESAEFCQELELRHHDNGDAGYLTVIAEEPRTAPSAQRETDLRIDGGVDEVRKVLSQWPELEIRFLSDERIEVKICNVTETKNYSEFGFEDRRNGKPNTAWILLRELAKSGGTISGGPSNKNWSVVEKQVQALRTLFRDRYGIEDDPVPFLRNVGYRARFKIGAAPSFES